MIDKFRSTLAKELLKIDVETCHVAVDEENECITVSLYDLSNVDLHSVKETIEYVADCYGYVFSKYLIEI